MSDKLRRACNKSNKGNQKDEIDSFLGMNGIHSKLSSFKVTMGTI